MSVGSGRAQLAFALKNLNTQWDLVQDQWRDSVRDDFAEQHFVPLTLRIPSVLTALDTLDQVIAQLQNECD